MYARYCKTRDNVAVSVCGNLQPSSPINIPVVMTIAGSDSGGGAGIQADLKAFSVCGAHGVSVITALTAQNTTEVQEVMMIEPEMIRAQAKAILSDIQVHTVKVGMLGDARTIESVAGILSLLPKGVPVVHDPVMVAESGARLLQASAVQALVKHIIGCSTVVTPNLAEARVLASVADAVPLDVAERYSPRELVCAIAKLGPEWVLLTGGHLTQAWDLLFDGDNFYELISERVADGAAHGSGCTHSSVLAAALAYGADVQLAACIAKEAATEAVKHGLRHVGVGAGPVDVVGLHKPRVDVRSRMREVN